MEPTTTLWWLVVGHALCDFTLQTDAMAKGKNRHVKSVPPPNVKLVPCWPYWLSAHALIHGGCVALVTGSVTLGIAELVLHWSADFLKCEGITNVHADQAIHLGCKVLWSVLLV